MALAFLEPLRRGTENLFDTLGEGWDWLRDRSASAPTLFRGNDEAGDPGLPEFARGNRWGLLSADVAETDTEVVVRLEAPGLDEKDLSVTVVHDRLIVRGEKRFVHEDESAEYHLVESAYGSFERRFSLPCEVRSDQAAARYRNGVLTVRLPRSEHARRKRIRVKAA